MFLKSNKKTCSFNAILLYGKPLPKIEKFGIKYPGFGEAMQNENLRSHFIHFLTYGADECLYDYNEKEIIKDWY